MTERDERERHERRARGDGGTRNTLPARAGADDGDDDEQRRRGDVQQAVETDCAWQLDRGERQANETREHARRVRLRVLPGNAAGRIAGVEEIHPVPVSADRRSDRQNRQCEDRTPATRAERDEREAG